MPLRDSFRDSLSLSTASLNLFPFLTLYFRGPYTRIVEESDFHGDLNVGFKSSPLLCSTLHE